jgi:hypothetical protein
MLERVAVALRGGGMEKARAIASRNLEGVFDADRAYAQRLDGQAKILRRTGGRSKVENIIHRAAIKRLADVALLELEARIAGQVSDVIAVTGAEVIDADDSMTLP